MAVRLQKLIAEAGLMSRRAAEQAILAGRVSCNGKTARLGDTASDGDEVLVDGAPLPAREKKHYYMLNKPRGYVCTMHDEQGRRSVRELLPPSAGRVYPVGRLDLMSEGLLLMTNDGEFALMIMHPSGRIVKKYRTSVRGDEIEKGIARLKQTFELDGVQVQAVRVHTLKSTETTAVLDITIGEGRNRQIRRMCEIAGLRVSRLIRVAEGPLRLDGLPSGQYHELSAAEVARIMEEAGK